MKPDPDHRVLHPILSSRGLNMPMKDLAGFVNMFHPQAAFGHSVHSVEYLNLTT